MTVLGSASVRGEGSGGSDAAGAPEPVLQASGISKRYGPVQALAATDLSVLRGEVHALVGENGSGKSTFVAIVSGVVAPDTGTVDVAGQRLRKHSPAVSLAAGVLTVFQDGSLIPGLTVAQNLYAGTPRALRPRYSAIDSWAARMLADNHMALSPGTPASELAAGDRQLLEILRAAAASPDLLLLDEATSALDSAGVDRVVQLVGDVARRGTAVLFVTHRLSEVFRVADRVSVLRDGVLQATVATRDVDAADLVGLMAGTRVDLEFPERHPLDPDAAVVLTADRLTGPAFGPVDLELRTGQIVGLAGADGNGQRELLRALAKIDSPAGVVMLNDAPLRGYRSAVARGAIVLSRDRRTESLFQALSVRENIVASALPRLARLGIVPPVAERRFVAERINSFGVRLASPAQLPAELSGGNQQKVALSRVLATEPRVVLVDEPTQGVDVRSRLDIYRLLRGIADAGSSIVVVSSDASELAGFCDRIVVLSRGRVTAELAGLDATEEKIVHAFAVEPASSDAGDPAGASHGSSAPSAPSAAEPSSRGTSAARSLAARLRIGSNAARLLGLAAIIVVLSVLANSKNSTFLSGSSIYNVLLLALPLVLVAVAEFCVLLVGGIDVSIGSVMSLTVVTISFWAKDSGAGSATGGAILSALVCGLAVGLVNAWLVERRGLSPVIATIATLSLAGGVALVLRPTAAGSVSMSLSDGLTKRIGVFPAPLLVIVVIIIAGDIALRRSGLGLRIRAVGLNGTFAHRLGTNTVAVRSAAYLLCGLLAAVAGVLLAAQVGVGDASTGSGYTLLAIAAPVLGGASLLGGRGMLIGAALGALLLALAESLVPALGVSDATSYLFTGGLTLIGLAVYSRTWRARNQA
jgi:ribose transport system ATP-binding protein